MKVIASTSGSHYLVEASADELNRIAGKQLTEGGYYNNDAIRIGTTFDIRKGWERINAYAARPREIQTVRKTLEGVLQQLEFVEPLMQVPHENPEAAS